MLSRIRNSPAAIAMLISLLVVLPVIRQASDVVVVVLILVGAVVSASLLLRGRYESNRRTEAEPATEPQQH